MKNFLISLMVISAMGMAFSQELSEDSRAGADSRIALPTVGEFFVALDALALPTWNSFVKESSPQADTGRIGLAFLLGKEITGAFVAVQAQDAQAAKNNYKEIQNLAKTLNVSQNILGRANSLSDFVTTNQWIFARQEIEITQNEIRTSLLEQMDSALVVMMDIGIWVRVTHLAGQIISASYTPEGAKFFYQEGIVRRFISSIESLPEATRQLPEIEKLYEKITGLISIVTTPVPESQQITTDRKSVV